eukprot:COSAG01_NODE_2162_length_8259_cov_2.289371_8_plen_106_part_00
MAFRASSLSSNGWNMKQRRPPPPSSSSSSWSSAPLPSPWAPAAVSAVKTATYRVAVGVQSAGIRLVNCDHGDSTTSRFDSPSGGGWHSSHAKPTLARSVPPVLWR